MKVRGTLGGINLLIEADDTEQRVLEGLVNKAGMLAAEVTLELSEGSNYDAVQAAHGAVLAAGGSVRPLRLARIDPAGRPDTPRPAAQTGAEPPAGEQASPPVVRRSLSPSTLSADGRTVILHHNVRAGFRGEYRGSVVVLGDVNPGAELVAGGDIIVLGALRGLAHAGAEGNAEAVVYARPIASPQLRIHDRLARAEDGSSLGSMKKLAGPEEAELARLEGGVIVITPHHPERS